MRDGRWRSRNGSTRSRCSTSSTASAVTGRHLFKKKVTIQYPEQKKLPSDRFRGMFRLDEERCIKCTLCAIECPINIIYIDWHNEKNEAAK